MQLMQAMLKAGGAPGAAPAPVEAMPNPMAAKPAVPDMSAMMAGGMPALTDLGGMPNPASSAEGSSASAPAEKPLGQNIPAAFRNMNRGEKVAAPPPAPGGCSGIAGAVAGLVQNP